MTASHEPHSISQSDTRRRVVVVGGGTGTYTVLRGLKRYADTLHLSAIVTMADSGGSTGRLRDEYGYLPVGDVRMALSALAADTGSHDELLRALFMYRFHKGAGLAGHTFGNLLLTALTDILGTEDAAITAAAKILRVAGEVVPVTRTPATLVATYADGTVLQGEHEIDEPKDGDAHGSIKEIQLTPTVSLHPRAAAALAAADTVVLGPGDLYTSVIANCVVDGFAAALTASQAKVVYVANLMTKVGQTTGYGVAEHVAEITAYCGRAPDVVIANSAPFPADILARYHASGEHPVVVNVTSDPDTVLCCEPVVATEMITTTAGDTLTRSLIRHDSDRLADIIVRLTG